VKGVDMEGDGRRATGALMGRVAVDDYDDDGHRRFERLVRRQVKRDGSIDG
jgi:hypothetical protein